METAGACEQKRTVTEAEVSAMKRVRDLFPWDKRIQENYSIQIVTLLRSGTGL